MTLAVWTLIALAFALSAYVLATELPKMARDAAYLNAKLGEMK